MAIVLRVTTASGTAYDFDAGRGRVRRVPVPGEEHAMRRDGEWLDVEPGTVPEVGFPLVMLLEPLGEGDVTQRTTSPVTGMGEVEIED